MGTDFILKKEIKKKCAQNICQWLDVLSGLQAAHIFLISLSTYLQTHSPIFGDTTWGTVGFITENGNWWNTNFISKTDIKNNFATYRWHKYIWVTTYISTDFMSHIYP